MHIPASKNKTNTARDIPLNPTVMEVIESLYVKPHKSQDFVLSHPASKNTVIRKLKKLSREIIGEEITSHYLRYTFANRSKGRIVYIEGRPYPMQSDQATVARVGGWEADSSVLKRIYQQPTEEQMTACVNLVDTGLPGKWRRGEKVGEKWTELDTNLPDTLSPKA